MNNQWNVYHLPSEIYKVPDNVGGIYFFTLRFPTDYELGVYTDIEFLKIKKNLMNFLDTFAFINSSKELDGIMKNSKAIHLQTIFSLNAIENISIMPSGILNEITTANKEELVELIFILRSTLQFSKPIYIGLAKNQSLQTRLKQHISDQSNMHKFMHVNKLNWDMIQYNCFPLKNTKLLRQIEKLLQNLVKPEFSSL